MLTGPSRFRLLCAVLFALAYGTWVFVPWPPTLSWTGFGEVVVAVEMATCIAGVVRPRPYQRRILLATAALVLLPCTFLLYLAYKFPLSLREGPPLTATELAFYWRGVWGLRGSLAAYAGALYALLRARRWLKPPSTRNPPGAAPSLNGD